MKRTTRPRPASLLLASILFLAAAIPLTAESETPSVDPEENEPMSDLSQFPYESKYVEVLGSRMHYVEAGEGDPVLFVHGQPTSSYLWRNILPYVEGRGRVIAVDLIGMGKSGKPSIDYRYSDHKRYFEGFVEALGLDDLTLVGHDWGSVLAFDYAMNHEDTVVGLAFMEALVPPAFPLPSLEDLPESAREIFAGFRDPKMGRELLIEQNLFVEAILPEMTIRELSAAEMNAYRAPFANKADREPVYRWPNELPIGGKPADTDALLRRTGDWLQRSAVPKLHIYASPGAANPPEVVEWTSTHFPNIETAFVGAGLHFIQEDQPEAIGRALDDWLRRLQAKGSSTSSTDREAEVRKGPAAMSAFIIFHGSPKNRDKFQEYARAVGPTLESFGGEVALRGKIAEVHSGQHSHEIVGILKFPDLAAAQGWYDSPAPVPASASRRSCRHDRRVL